MGGDGDQSEDRGQDRVCRAPAEVGGEGGRDGCEDGGGQSSGGWLADKHPRFLADTTGGGSLDVVGCHDNGLWVSLQDEEGKFAPLADEPALQAFGHSEEAGGWLVDKHPRFLADTTGLPGPEVTEQVADHVHSRTAEADDVDASVAGDVSQEAGVAVDPPSACVFVVPEPAAHQLGLLEAAVAVVVRYPDAFVAEADDVRDAVTGDVGEEPECFSPVHPWACP